MEYYTNCFLTFMVPDTYSIKEVGLSIEGSTTFKYGISLQNGQIFTYYNDELVTPYFGIYNAGDVFTITVDKYDVYYYRNGRHC